MTNIEILNYFSGNTVYQFSGTEKEFRSWQTELGHSYNYIIVNGSIYFISQGQIDDPRAVIVTEEQ